MVEYYTIKQIVELSGLTDNYVRRVLKRNKIEEAYTHKREKYYHAEDVHRVFTKYFSRSDDYSTGDTETQYADDIVIRRVDYEQMVANLGILKGKLDELEQSRQYWERERQELKQHHHQLKEDLERRIQKLEEQIEEYREKEIEGYKEKLESYEQRSSWWKRWFG